MKRMKENALMNLPSDIKMMLIAGKYSLYTLPKSYASKGAYLLAMSRNDTFFVQENGIIGAAAGRLGEIDVEDVVRLSESDLIPSIKVNIA